MLSTDSGIGNHERDSEVVMRRTNGSSMERLINFWTKSPRRLALRVSRFARSTVDPTIRRLSYAPMSKHLNGEGHQMWFERFSSDEIRLYCTVHNRLMLAYWLADGAFYSADSAESNADQRKLLGRQVNDMLTLADGSKPSNGTLLKLIQIEHLYVQTYCRTALQSKEDSDLTQATVEALARLEMDYIRRIRAYFDPMDIETRLNEVLLELYPLLFAYLKKVHHPRFFDLPSDLHGIKSKAESLMLSLEVTAEELHNWCSRYLNKLLPDQSATGEALKIRRQLGFHYDQVVLSQVELIRAQTAQIELFEHAHKRGTWPDTSTFEDLSVQSDKAHKTFRDSNISLSLFLLEVVNRPTFGTPPSLEVMAL